VLPLYFFFLAHATTLALNSTISPKLATYVIIFIQCLYILGPPRERYSLAQPYDGAPRSCTQISPTLPPSRRLKFPNSLHINGGSQHTGRFSGRNARDQMSFGHRPVAVSWWPEYSVTLFQL